MKQQLTDKIFMVRPRCFGFNVETQESNKFQNNILQILPVEISNKAQLEFDDMVNKLLASGITVDVFDDLPESLLPDSVFPNNWIVTEEDGIVYTFPMYAPIRRQERREDIIDFLSNKYIVSRRYSLELFEDQNQFLEGTGSLILDRVNRIAYACLSPRTDPRVMDKFSLLSGYQAVYFNAKDAQGHEIYHTNVMMAMGQDFVICCVEAIQESQKSQLLQSFSDCGKKVVDITFKQMENFAGNMLVLKNSQNQPILVCSRKAYDSLTTKQIELLEKSAEFLVIELDVIETIGGGSARCMIAENFLNLKK